MLISLYAKNYLLIDELRIAFEGGLNIITGETGAGKSILIGALGALLGDRLQKEAIRSGADKAIIEGEFHVPGTSGLQEFVAVNDLDDPRGVLLIRREVAVTGKSRCFINDTPVSVALLAELGELLVDLHGQHEHQRLLKVAHHGAYLDAFAGLHAEIEAFKAAYQHFVAAIRELRETQARAAQLAQSRDFMQFQLQEIEAVAPAAGEEEGLLNEEQILRHAELLYERSGSLFQRLYEGEGSAAELLTAASTDLGQLLEIDQRFAALKEECENARILVDELAKSIRHYNQSITFEPERLEKIRERLAALNGLKRKHGGTLDAVIALRDRLKSELDLVENLSETLSALSKNLEAERLQMAGRTQELAQRRQKAATLFSQQVVESLALLGMPKARFEVQQASAPGNEEPWVLLDGKAVRIGPRGADHLAFLLAANPGQEIRPLADVASGGEVSRVMLALKTILAEADQVPVLVFDEIDIGISGRIAQAVGGSLRELARRHQVICITHLPQIASMADHHFLVEKGGDDTSTRTTIRRLNAEENVRQIASLIGGARVTETHLRSARELIAEAGTG